MNLPAILSYGGVTVFVGVLLTDLAFLLWDAWLLLTDRPTLSDRVWSASALAVGILGWQFIGIIGLAAHLAISPHVGTRP